MYESPITLDIGKTEFKNIFEADLMKAVVSYDIRVDKDELMRALQYDRDQYAKGYKDGAKDLEEQAKYHFVNCCELLGMTVRMQQFADMTGFELLFASSRYGRQLQHRYVVSNTNEFWSRWDLQYVALKTADRSMEELAKKAAMSSLRDSYTYQRQLERFYELVHDREWKEARWFLGRILEANGVAHADKVAGNIV